MPPRPRASPCVLNNSKSIFKLSVSDRILALAINYNLIISQIDGGSLRNAIPRESVAKIVVDSKYFLKQLDGLAAEIKSEFFKSEPDLIVINVYPISKLMPKTSPTSGNFTSGALPAPIWNSSRYSTINLPLKILTNP